LEKVTVEKTFVIKGKAQQDWLLVNADSQNLGRLATKIAGLLMGKHKATYTPGVEMGDMVVVVNASKIQFYSERAMEKFYYSHSGYPGGIKSINLRDQLRYHADRVIRSAVWGMLPHNKMGRRMLKNLMVYGGAEHPHQAQNPQPLA
jgi:large subunit ribosomal protein L13